MNSPKSCSPLTDRFIRSWLSKFHLLNRRALFVLTTVIVWAMLLPNTDPYTGNHRIARAASADPVASALLLDTETTTTLSLTTRMEEFDAIPYFFFNLAAKVTAEKDVPSGVVTFYWIDSLGQEQIIGNENINSQGLAYYRDWRFDEPQTYELRARFQGDEGFESSTSDALIHTWVNGINIIANSTPNPSTAGTPVDLEATVYSPNGTPTGTVTFFHMAPAQEKEEIIGTAMLNADGVASFSWTPDAGGVYPIYGRYEGDSNFTTISSTAVIHFVAGRNEPLTETNIVLSPFARPTADDLTISLTASVASDRGIPRGEVTFFAVDSDSRKETVIETVEPNLLGLASVPWTPDGNSSHLVARFVENEVFAASASERITATTSSETITVLESAKQTIAKGETLSLVATTTPIRHIASFAGAPTGQVEVSWYDSDSGIEHVIDNVDIDANGVANLDWTPDASCYSVSAKYEGDSYFDFSGSSLEIAVTNGGDLTGFTHCPTTTSVVSTPNPSVTGQEVSVTATVSSIAGTPAGTVKFYLPGDEATEDIIGTVELDASGVAILRITPDSRFGGCTELSITYEGNSHFKAVDAGLTLPIADKAMCDTGLNLIDRLQPMVVGQAFTLEASVYSVAVFDGTPNGIVTFFYVDSTSNSEQIIGTAELDATGSASLDWVPNMNTTMIGARYEGGVVFNPSSDSRSAWLVDNSVRTPAIYLPLFSR